MEYASQRLPTQFNSLQTLAHWLNKYHRLSKDYERLCEMSKATIYVVMTGYDWHRLAT